jgi:hypothetical protein
MDHALRQGAYDELKRRQYMASDTRQALEGKDVKDLLLNVGSGGGAAAAPAAGGAAPAAAGDAPAKEEEKEEGTLTQHSAYWITKANALRREGGVGRRHGLRSLRLSAFLSFTFARLPSLGFSTWTAAHHRCCGGPVTMVQWHNKHMGISVNTITAS